MDKTNEVRVDGSLPTLKYLDGLLLELNEIARSSAIEHRIVESEHEFPYFDIFLDSMQEFFVGLLLRLALCQLIGYAIHPPFKNSAASPNLTQAINYFDSIFDRLPGVPKAPIISILLTRPRWGEKSVLVALAATAINTTLAAGRSEPTDAATKMRIHAAEVTLLGGSVIQGVARSVHDEISTIARTLKSDGAMMSIIVIELMLVTGNGCGEGLIL